MTQCWDFEKLLPVSESRFHDQFRRRCTQCLRDLIEGRNRDLMLAPLKIADVVLAEIHHLRKLLPGEIQSQAVFPEYSAESGCNFGSVSRDAQ